MQAYFSELTIDTPFCFVVNRFSRLKCQSKRFTLVASTAVAVDVVAEASATSMTVEATPTVAVVVAASAADLPLVKAIGSVKGTTLFYLCLRARFVASYILLL